MKIRREPYTVMDITEFAERHDLTMVVSERAMDAWQRAANLSPWFARFDRAEVIGDGVLLSGVHGNGATEDAAIANYADRISTTRIVVDAMGTDRREIDVPRLTYSLARKAGEP